MMAKRFTDTDKWQDPWFRNLTPDYQRFWVYLLDRCDQAGVWEVDFELVSFFLKVNFKEKEAVEILKDRIVIFSDKKKWFIPKFITFQYGALNESCRPHQYVFRLLKNYKLEGYLKGIQTLKDKDKDKDKDKGGVGGISTGYRLWKCFVGDCGKEIPESQRAKHMDFHQKEHAKR